ncbi:MAG: glycosyltransferase [Bdellovibrionota bacterium]
MSSVLPENSVSQPAPRVRGERSLFPEDFRPCVVVPVYNHQGALRSTVERLKKQQLPLILVDDASSDGGGSLLDELASDTPSITVIHRKVNGGKGAAVMDGIRLATRKGFTHALQVDADGQHDIESIPQFLAVGAQFPTSLVLGFPRFDASAPWGRVWGRKISNVLLRFEIFRFLNRNAPRDALFGFRLYPIQEFRSVFLDEEHFERMEFDTEILAKLCWAGASVKNIETPVRYPDDGVSHFRYLEDNLCLIRLHVGLLLRMLPKLIGGWLSRSPHTRAYFRRWEKHDERGSMFWVKFLFAAPRFLGTRICNAIAYPVILYFIATNTKARGASRDYLRRALGVKTPADVPFSAVYRHFLEFARALVDRAAVWNGRLTMESCRFHGKEPLRERINRGEGLILIGAHFGNLEVCRALSEELPRLEINALMYMENAKKYNAILRATNANAHLKVLPIEDTNPEMLVSLKAKLEAGECLAMLADRITPGSPEKVAEVEFFGEPTLFPTGPFIFASLLDAPVYLVFCIRAADGTYDVYMEHFSEGLHLPRAKRNELLKETAGKYASRLEHYVKQAPYQWFNYFYFWGK